MINFELLDTWELVRKVANNVKFECYGEDPNDKERVFYIAKSLLIWLYVVNMHAR